MPRSLRVTAGSRRGDRELTRRRRDAAVLDATHSAPWFADVRVDEDLGEIRVPRVVTAHDVGRILNAKTAKSQIAGVWSGESGRH